MFITELRTDTQFENLYNRENIIKFVIETRTQLTERACMTSGQTSNKRNNKLDFDRENHREDR